MFRFLRQGLREGCRWARGAKSSPFTPPFFDGGPSIAPCTRRVRGPSKFLPWERSRFRPQRFPMRALGAANFCKKGVTVGNKGRRVTTVNSRRIFYSFPTVPSVRIVALIVTHTDWVCRVARVLYLFYYFDMVATIVLLRVVVSDYTYQDIKDCGRILLG